jgi:hypothetical protein
MNVIILYDRVFECHRIYLSGSAFVKLDTLQDSLNYIKHFPQLREVPINSRAGREILKRIGTDEVPF